MMQRRALVAVVAALAAPKPMLAQQPGKPVRIGWLGNTAPGTPEAFAIWDAFRLELQRRGWSEGRNVVFERRFAEGVADRFPQLARELIESKVDVIVASSGRAASAAKKATDTIPVVFASVPGPVEQGLVASLARPGGNLTGLATLGNELTGKRLELLKEAFPRISRVAVLSSGPEADQEAQRTAAALGVQLLTTRAQRAEDLPGAIAALPQADAWFVQDGLMHFANRRTIVELVAKQVKPAIYPHVIYVEAGGLMSYSVDLKDQFRRAAGYVDRILRGAKPADLPVEQPTQFELAINLKTAKALGLAIPKNMLLRAERVIE